MPMSTYLANALLDHFLKTGSYTQPTHVYVSLHSADPAYTGASELSGNSYARVQHDGWDSAATRHSENTGVITFPTASGDWSAATYFGLWDASTAGNFLGGAALDASKTVQSGDTASFADGELDITIDP